MNIDRRRFVAGLAAAGFDALQCFGAESPKSFLEQTRKTSLVDVHHHFIPSFYFSENRERIAQAAGGRMHPAYPSWSSEQMIAAMDAQGVTLAILSLTTPGVWFGNAQEATRMARRLNEYAAELIRSHPGRLGLFAVIPLPDTESSLHEIEYAYSVIKADGIGIMTSYDDKWLGDPVYKPVFEELNRRKAVIFVHPTTGLCCRNLLPEVNPIMLEIPQDTTRAVANLLFSGTFTKFKDIRFIFTHAGGNVPMTVIRMHEYGGKNITDKVPNGIEYEIRKLYYDIAGTAYRPAIAALTELVPSTQILFGSDHPFIPLAETAQGMTKLGFTATDFQKVSRDNALALLPQQKTISAA
ncbi:MAG TPA: amidohydrolase family protein [Terriglobales bacterium]|jgi:6-methylsalicylate decarboxylase|nr:amidohydrolase family protein [Terriglobales bacterium]